MNQGYRERELSNKLTNFTVAGLTPGETYGIQLKTKVYQSSSLFKKHILNKKMLIIIINYY